MDAPHHATLEAVPAASATVGTLTLLRPANVPAPARSQRRFTCKTQTLLRAAPDLSAAPARVFTYAVAPVCAAIAIPPLLPCKPPSAHPKFRPQAAIVAPPPARFAGQRLLPLLDVNWQLR